MRTAALAVLFVMVLCATAVAGSFGFYFSPAAATQLSGAGGEGGALRPEGSVVGLFNNLTGAEVDGLVVRFSRPVDPVYAVGVGAAFDLVSNENGELLYAGRAVPEATWEIDWYSAGERLEYAAWLRGGHVIEEICTHCPTASFLVTGQFMGQEVTFNAIASGDPDGLPIARYVWTWSDGATAEGVVARRMFSEPGVYTATLTVVDADANEDVRSERLTVLGCELDIAVRGLGAVAEKPEGESHAFGTLVGLTAEPAPGWHFVGWSGDLSGSVNPAGLTMDGSKTVTAAFEIDTFMISSSASGSGSINPAGDAAVAYGSDQPFSITPDAHNHIADVLVDGVSVGAVGSYTFGNVTAGHSIQAVFAVDEETLTVSTTGNGTVSRTPDSASYAHGTPVSLTAAPALGWHFVGWSGDLSGSANPAGLTMDGSKTVTAAFEIDTFMISSSASGSGSINPAGDAAVAYGSDQPFSITPDAHNHIADVLVDGVSVGAVGSYTFGNVTAGHSIQAVFAVDEETLTVSTTGNGTVSRTPDSASYAHGTPVSLTAAPALGWHFVGWSGDLSGSANPAGLTMDGSKTVMAIFAADLTAQIVDRNLSIYRGTYATLRALTLPGASCTITVTLPSGSTSTAAGLSAQVADADGMASWTWLVAGNTLPGMGSITVTASDGGQVRQDVVPWHVLPHQYSLGVTAVGSGTVTRDPDQALYDFGTVVTLTANPVAGWHFVSWSGDASGSAIPASVTINENKSVTATFAQDPSGMTVQILDRALAVYRGNYATLSAQTLPGASCSIVVMLPSGKASTAAGLGPKVAGADGRASWTWLVGGTTGTGVGSITVTAVMGSDAAQDTVSWTVLAR